MIRRDAGYIPGIAECISSPTPEGIQPVMEVMLSLSGCLNGLFYGISIFKSKFMQENREMKAGCRLYLDILTAYLMALAFLYLNLRKEKKINVRMLLSEL
jgi:hypothetical protein